MPRPYRHPKTDVFYYRERVPRELLEIAKGKTAVVTVAGISATYTIGDVLQITLRTKDETEAAARYAEVLPQFAAIWRGFGSPPVKLTHKQCVALSYDIYRFFKETFEEDPHAHVEWAAHLDAYRRQTEQAANNPLAIGPSRLVPNLLRLAVDHSLAVRQLTVDDDSRTRLIAEFFRAFGDVTSLLVRRADGDYSPDEGEKRFPPVEADKPKLVTISDLVDLWERDHLANGGAPATPRDHRQKVNHFIAYFGHDDANRVTPKDVSDWCDTLQHDEGKSAKTVADKYLSALKAVFTVGAGKFVIPGNPVALVQRKVPKKVKERPSGFTDKEAEAILQMALVAENADGREPELTKLAFKWVPWLCAYTGARGGEIAQLRGEDFLVEYGEHAIRITPEAGTVKAGDYRLVPLHPHLIELGVLEMVERRGTGPLFYTPNDDPREAASTQWGNIRGKVGEWVRNKVGITDERIQPNHGWRHRFTTIADDVGIEPRYITAIQGHADGRASTGYGERTMKALGREIRKLPRYLPASQEGSQDPPAASS